MQNLNDENLEQRIDARLTRARTGNLGDFKKIGKSLYELRLHIGPGYRIYFGLDENEIIVLLIGGDKSTQSRDIKKARKN